VADRVAILRQLWRLKATGGARVHEMNTLFDTPSGTMAREGKLVRIRVERPAPERGAGKTMRKPAFSSSASPQPALLTYKGPAQKDGSRSSLGQRYKIRAEHEVRVEDATALAHVFENMGLRSCFRYEKYRSTYRLPGLHRLVVELDETPIGDFLELEGVREEIDRCAALLGFRQDDYITKSYGALFVEQRRSVSSEFGASAGLPADSAPAEMLFSSRP